MENIEKRDFGSANFEVDWKNNGRLVEIKGTHEDLQKLA